MPQSFEASVSGTIWSIARSLGEFIAARSPLAGPQTRCRVIVMASQGHNNEAIEAAIGLGHDAVGTWRRRWRDNWPRLISIECGEGIPGARPQSRGRTVYSDSLTLTAIGTEPSAATAGPSPTRIVAPTCSSNPDAIICFALSGLFACNMFSSHCVYAPMLL